MVSACRYAAKNSNGTFTLDLTFAGTALPAGDYRLCLCNLATCDTTTAAKTNYNLGVAYLTVVAYVLPPGSPGTAERPALSCTHVKAFAPSGWLHAEYNKMIALMFLKAERASSIRFDLLYGSILINK